MPATAGTELRLAELIASISLATDLGMGQPTEQALRTCLIALALERRRGCSGPIGEVSAFVDVSNDSIAVSQHQCRLRNSSGAVPETQRLDRHVPSGSLSKSNGSCTEANWARGAVGPECNCL
jgi:hypothetical protein